MVAMLLGVLMIATSHANGTSETVRFTKWTDIATPSADLVKYRQAVKSIKSDNGDCTATVISDSGHMLSARHCLSRCMIRSKVFEERLLEDGAVTYFEFSQKNAETAECKIQVDKQDVTIQIEASSPGFILAMHEATFKTLQGQIYRQFVEEGYTDNGDFVIFKIKGDSTLDDSCVPLSTRSVAAGDVQQTLGYPSATARPDGFNSDGVSLYYSKGTVASSIAENACVQSAPFKNKQYADLLVEFDTPTGFVSTFDAIYGSSGSSALGPDNAVAGVLTKTFRLAQYTKLESDEPENRYCMGSTRSISTETIISSIKKQGYDVSALTCAVK